MDLELSGDPCLVAGTLVAGKFGDRGYYVRQGFDTHPKVRRWLLKHHSPAHRTVSYVEFEQLERDALRV